MLSLCSRKHNAANHRQTAPLCCQASLCNSALAPLCHFPHSSPSFFRSHFPRSHDPTFFPLFSPFTNLSHLCVSWNPVQLKLESLSYCGCCSVTKLCLTLLGPLGLQPTRLFCLWDFSCNNTGMACHFFLQGIFPIQGSNPCFLHWQEGSLPLNHQGSQGKHRGLQNKQEQTTGIFSWKHLI